MAIPNVLASRYASDEMVAIWSPEAKIVGERRLWLAVLRAQIELGTDGVAVPPSVLDDYERVIEDVDLASIAERERSLRHDVKARIEEFNALAGHEHVHKGLTSRDLTENVEQTPVGVDGRDPGLLLLTPREVQSNEVHAATLPHPGRKL